MWLRFGSLLCDRVRALVSSFANPQSTLGITQAMCVSAHPHEHLRDYKLVRIAYVQLSRLQLRSVPARRPRESSHEARGTRRTSGSAARRRAARTWPSWAWFGSRD